MKEQVNLLNYIAIDLLERLGNEEPTEIQIEIIESILEQRVNRWTVPEKNLTLVEAIYILLAVKYQSSSELAILLNLPCLEVEKFFEKIKHKLTLSVLAQMPLISRSGLPLL